MSDKYAALRALAERSAAGSERAALSLDIRALSGTHPGALREGELVSPTEIERRRAACEAGQSQAPRSRAQWRDEGMAAVVLWHSAHHRISELMDARRKHRVATQGRLAYGDFYRSLDEAGRGNWVPPRAFALDSAQPLKLRAAYLALAYHADLSMPQLYGLLFERTGSWTRSSQDPPWARA